ncbi:MULTISPECIES: hypothetical protein [Aeromonas]|nr:MULTISPECIES: hypothetical protein [Aeromonas]MDX2125553.1 hypothetical protein [Aeromonas hydrophila]MBS4637930.1 hypothetical protein [Aeromonas caviae]MCX4035864.1 hypothetical protein [Aeromonas caviae]UCM45922.1 hypothetical protein LEO73_03885 [Aeromonas dhakensis]WQD89803.1 hypothetical protein U0022_03580 [Aeromonas caviae]
MRIFDKLFCKKNNKVILGELEISDMPKELNHLVSRLGLIKPNMCFMNSFLTVMQTLTKDEFYIHYVLVEITTHTGYKFEHAVIKWNGRYYDPTLEPQKLHKQTKYRLQKEFSPEEIVSMMTEKFGLDHIKLMINGEAPFWPLKINEHGEYDFIDA